MTNNTDRIHEIAEKEEGADTREFRIFGPP